MIRNQLTTQEMLFFDCAFYYALGSFDAMMPSQREYAGLAAYEFAIYFIKRIKAGEPVEITDGFKEWCRDNV